MGSVERSWSATLRHWLLAASASFWAKAVAMKAATTRRPFLPAWASALRAKCTRQRCQLARSTLATAALRPSWASETTSLTPRRPAAGQLAQEGRPEGFRFGRPDVHAEHFAAAVAVDADRDDDGGGDNTTVLADLHVRGVEPEIGPITLDRTLEEGLHLAVDLLAEARKPRSWRCRSCPWP